MLDEKLEFKKLTSAWDEKAQPLRYGNLSNHLSGLEHAMTIVARGFWFSDKKNTPSIACATAYLRSWCGLKRRSPVCYQKGENGWEQVDCRSIKDNLDDFFCYENCLGEKHYIEKLPDDPDGNKSRIELTQAFPHSCFRETCPYTEEIKRVYNWLPDYLWALKKDKIEKSGKEEEARDFFDALFSEKEMDEKIIGEQVKELNEAVKLNLFSLLLELSDKRTQFSRHVFHASLKDTDNGKNKEITYERILANAINAGPLQSYTLYTTNPDLDEKTCFANITKATGGKDDKDLSEANKRLLLAVAAVYLMGKAENREYVVFNTPAFTNWLQGNLPDGGFHIFHYGDKPLFRKSTVSGNIIKLRIEPQWLKDLGLGVCAAGQLPKNAVVISYTYKKNNNKTGNNYDLTFTLPGGEKND